MKANPKIFFMLIILSIILNYGCYNFENREAIKYYKKADNFRLSWKLDSSLINYNIADSLEPNNTKIINGRALLYGQMKNIDFALIDFDNAIKLASKQREKNFIIYNRALVYLDFNRTDEACQDFKNCGWWGKNMIYLYCK